LLSSCYISTLLSLADYVCGSAATGARRRSSAATAAGSRTAGDA
jgi:hypothetical protein